MRAGLLIIACWVIQGCSTLSAGHTPMTERANKVALAEALSAAPAEHKLRHSARNPAATLAFFGIAPGDTVVEALPGAGWYSQVLMPYLGQEGTLVGVDYAMDMFPHFGSYATPEFLESRKRWPQEWTRDAQAWGQANASAYSFATLPESLAGSADYFLFIRALHNLARFEDKGNYLSEALAEVRRVLKPGGYVGIVQHEVAEQKPDAWAKGDRGYLKKSFVIATLEAAGFDFIAESAINENPKDDLQDNQTVWRLPPSLRVDDAEKAQNLAIGESNRMTLLFKKR